MLSFLPGVIKGTFAALFLALNTTLWCLCLYIFVILKLISPVPQLKLFFSKVMVGIAENFISGNDFGLWLFHRITWDVRGLENVDYRKSYLVCANHQSWVDIVILQHIFNRRIPFLRFFIKRQLAYVPLLGLAWVALDFPLMKRYTKSFLEKHPEKRGEDLATTRRACERFKGKPISILNFLEGTRLTPSKHLASRSPFKNLLAPKTGGVAFVLDAMGNQFDSLLDVTIYYPDGAVSLWGLLSGDLQRVVVQVERVLIPPEVLNGQYFEDERFRERIQTWIRQLWERKDRVIEKLKTDVPGPGPCRAPDPSPKL